MRVLLLLGAVLPAVAATGLTLDVFNNTVLGGTPMSSTTTAFPISVSNHSNRSFEATGLLAFPGFGEYFIDCNFSDAVTVGFVWLADHEVCVKGAYTNDVHDRSSMDGSQAYPIIVTSEMNNLEMPVRIQQWSSGTTAGLSLRAAIDVQWQKAGAAATMQRIPATALSPSLPPLEQRRRDFQRPLIAGWGAWHPHNYLAFVSLPDSAMLEVMLCKLSTKECLTASIGPDDRACTIRPGLHALDRSYGQLYVNAFQAPTGLNVSLQFTAGEKGFRLAVHPVACVTAISSNNCSDFAVLLAPTFAWYRAGQARTVCQETQCFMDVVPAGSSLRAHHFTATITGNQHRSIADAASVDVSGFKATPSTNPVPTENGLALTFADLGSTVYLTSFKGEDPEKVASAISTAERVETDGLGAFGQLSDAVGSVRAAVMWNSIFCPAEQGPVLPVDKSWNLAKNPTSADWAYTMFQWDNHFGSLMMALDNGTAAMNLAISNYISTVRSTKTAKGFGSNYAAAGSKSVDRTEPPQAARVLSTLHKKYNATFVDSHGAGLDWLVELLFQDLLDWSNWFMLARSIPTGINVTTSNPSGAVVISLGSNAVDGFDDYSPGQIAAARMESGCDNSPMYDCDGEHGEPACSSLWNHSMGQMQLVDVGMSSMVISEAEHLAGLADIIGRTSDAVMLRKRAAALRAALQYTWDDSSGIFVNRFPNGGRFYKRISPTSFYPLMANAASDEQAAIAVKEWLLNPLHFAVSLNGDFGNNSDSNWWGLPSIAGSDPAFPALGYWRGFVWGPMVQLVYWSLLEYDHVPVVRAARKGLAKQMTALTLSQWKAHGHICENFSPRKDSVDCTGTKFYHWGALGSLVSLMEAGVY